MPLTLAEEFDALSDPLKEAIEAEFSRQIGRGTAHQMRHYPVLATRSFDGVYEA
ncbi:hypothetical protein [Sphingosinicella sp. BN140058]|uniref:hypothetical protein n=1 Tax=Sphingosinicella sp. BN140058 TaxID=1892855 RepID=UPI0013EB6B74|nr:hypothetical protein [Sphingosinicella sp. BN140058]